MNEMLKFKVLEREYSHELEDALEEFIPTLKGNGWTIGDIKYSVALDGMVTVYSALIAYYADIHEVAKMNETMKTSGRSLK